MVALYIFFMVALLSRNCLPLWKADINEYLRVDEDCCKMAIDDTENLVGFMTVLTAQNIYFGLLLVMVYACIVH